MAALVQAGQIQVHGHRGARALRPENTMPAFLYAIEAGVDVLELDLAVTKDNVLVVSHDPLMNPAYCTGPEGTRVIREMTFAELQRWDCGGKANPDYPQQQAVAGTRVPALDEVLRLAPRGKFEFNIETKIFRDRPQLTPSPEEFAGLLAAAIEKHQLVSRVMVQSFDFRTLEAMKRLLPKVRLSALFGNKEKDYVSAGMKTGAAIVSPHYTLITPGNVAAARRAGMQVVPWTANTAADWDRLIAAKVDAIITDDPAALIAHLKSKGLR
ncbi:MAG: glycerophosphodiester phosphodiesterase [Bryobacterales bacterium]|nr:glycerophosphodiester phosphodiesterase [Bryobacterales bacterium]